MGLFNIAVVPALTPCPGCGSDADQRVQYKYGHVWQLEVRPGDPIVWERPSVGDPAEGTLRVVGVREYCRSCGWDPPDGEYCAVDVSDGVLAGACLLAPAQAAELLREELERGW